MRYLSNLMRETIGRHSTPCFSPYFQQTTDSWVHSFEQNWYMELLWNGMSGIPWVSNMIQNYSVASTWSHSIQYQKLQYSCTDEFINRSKISNKVNNYFPPDVAMFAKTFCTYSLEPQSSWSLEKNLNQNRPNITGPGAKICLKSRIQAS